MSRGMSAGMEHSAHPSESEQAPETVTEPVDASSVSQEQADSKSPIALGDKGSTCVDQGVEDPPPKSPNTTLGDIDPAAVIAASLAVVIGWVLGPGSWGALSIPVGLVVVTVVLGFYGHPPKDKGTMRSRVQRMAVGAVLAFGIIFIVAWPLQDLVVAKVVGPECRAATEANCVAETTTSWLTGLWFVLTVLLACCQDRVLTWLDKPSGQKLQALA
jgi:hypothetical protein